MPTPLEEWQNRLERHFTQLAAARDNSGFPLFALEHGLNEDEIDEISGLLHAQLADGWKIGRFWLLWVVYATEFGYDYDGGEYWPSFEERTPHWRQPITATRRNQLRSWFSRFQSTYQGVKPTGQWAEHFSIIAWPVTHAILPRYLQRQFAHALYDLRYQLTHLDSLTALAFGRLLEGNAWDESSRFREFLQQQELTGRIVISLLSDRVLDGQSPIYPPTLERLVSDLEEVQSSREWLKETRLTVADRLKGVGRPGAGSSPQRHPGEGANRPAPRIRPTIIVRRSTATTWSVVIHLPSFTEVARLDPQFNGLLRRTRCRIAGTGDTWLPNGWLLSGPRRRVLRTWPGAGTPFVQFEQSSPALDQLVSAETRLAAGPVWVCRLGADGLGQEVIGRTVRPGTRYILLSETALSAGHGMLSYCSVDCAGVHAALLSVPHTVSSEASAWLRGLGVQLIRTVRVFPAGLSARGFDGEGHSEWLTTESPSFGLVHDHPVDRYTLRLDGESEITIEAYGSSAPVFVKVARLAPGRHMLFVKAHRQGVSGPQAAAAEGVVTLDVREPEPWIPGTTSHSGLSVVVDPANPSLDDFWAGRIRITVLGPADHQVSCEMHLYGASGQGFMKESVGSFDLPLTPEGWEKRFSAFAANEERAWTYAEAISGSLIIKGEELGEYALRLERDVEPVRWACRNVSKAATVRLIDDTGGDTAPVCSFLGFRHPVLPVAVQTDSAMAGLQAEPPGGLFQASCGKFHDEIIVSIPPAGHGFADLLIEPDLACLQNDDFPIMRVLAALTVWSGGRLVGPLVDMRRNRILDRLANRLFSRLCGQQWADAEADYLANGPTGIARHRLEHSVGGPQAFLSILAREFDRMDASADSGADWFFGVAARYQISSDRGLCDFGLRLAGHPPDLQTMVPVSSVLDGLLAETKEKAIVLRAARLVALLSASRKPGPYGKLFPRWKWS